MWRWPAKLEPMVGYLFLWSGYAIWVAIIARFILSFRTTRSPWLNSTWATFCMGMLSVTIATFVVRAFIAPEKGFSPFAPPCIIASILVAVAVNALLLFVLFLSPDNDYYEDEYYEDEYYEDDERDRDVRGRYREERPRDYRDEREVREPARPRRRRDRDLR